MTRLKYCLKTIPMVNIFVYLALSLYAIFLIFTTGTSYVDFLKVGSIVLPLGAMAMVTTIARDEVNLYNDILRTKKKGITVTLIFKWLISIFVIIASTTIYSLLYSKIAEVEKVHLIIINFCVISIVVGTIGFISYIFTKNTIVSYVIPMMYYGFEAGTKGKFTNNFYLFIISWGEHSLDCLKLFSLCMILFIISLIYINKK